MTSSLAVRAPVITKMASAAVEKNRRLHIQTDGTVQHATAAQAGHGVATRSASSGDEVGMLLWNAEGTFRLVASEAIGLGVDVEGAHQQKHGDDSDQRCGA